MKKTCTNGHTFFKSSDCPTCPVCEKMKKKESEWYFLSAPAKRALENAGIDSVMKLAKFTEKEILKLHGIGPSAIPKLKVHLKKSGLFFKSI